MSRSLSRRKIEIQAGKLACSSEIEREAKILDAELVEARKPLDRIRDGFCKAHETGKPCICSQHPDFESAVATVTPVIDRRNALWKRQDDARRWWVNALMRKQQLRAEFRKAATNKHV